MRSAQDLVGSYLLTEATVSRDSTWWRDGVAPVKTPRLPEVTLLIYQQMNKDSFYTMMRLERPL